MKKTLVLLFVLLLLVPALAFADVIVEPDNSFYRTHHSECQRWTGRTYLANGPDGTLDLYTAPTGTVAETLKNGTAFYCQWAYTDKEGAVWGFSERHEAWAPLGYTLVQYDETAFELEHGNEIITAADQPVTEYATVYLYEYPGASDPIQLDRVDLIAEKLYTDDQGRQWGFVSYIHAIRDKWFCLDEPANPDLAGAKRAAVPSGFQTPTMLPTGSQLGVIIGVVCGVAVGTLTAVLILFRRKRR